jgi:hypothetical protein
MAQPTAYSKTTNFAQDESNNVGGRAMVRTSNLDSEFVNIETTLRQTLSNLSLIQRDDGQLRDSIVQLYHLSSICRLALQANMTPRGPWQTFTSYAANDLVEVSEQSYICVTAHTSGTFLTDYAAGLWQILTSSGVVNLTDYAALRAYAGESVFVNITDYGSNLGSSGGFTRDDDDTTSADNGGTIIVTSAGKRWKRTNTNGVFNTSWFGSIADGTAHPLSERFATLAAAQAVYPFALALTQQIDYCAIQAALNAAGLAGGGTVFLSPGVHYIGGLYGLQIYYDDVEFIGAGSGTSVIYIADWQTGANPGYDNAQFSVSKRTNTPISNVRIAHIGFRGTKDYLLDYNWFSPAGWGWAGLQFGYVGSTKNCGVEYCSFENTGGAAMQVAGGVLSNAVDADVSKGFYCRHNYVDNTIFSGLEVISGGIRDGDVSHNTIRRTSGGGILYSGTSGRIHNNAIEYTSNYGIACAGYAGKGRYTVISENKLFRCGGGAPGATSVSPSMYFGDAALNNWLNVHANTIVDAYGPGVLFIGGSEDLICKDNVINGFGLNGAGKTTIFGANWTGIQALNCTRVLVDGNTVIANGDAAYRQETGLAVGGGTASYCTSDNNKTLGTFSTMDFALTFSGGSTGSGTMNIVGRNNWNMTTGKRAEPIGSGGTAIPLFSVDLDTTPSVAGHDMMEVANSAPTVITNLDDGYIPQEVTLIFDDGNTTINNGGNFRMQAGNFVSALGRSITFRKTLFTWWEIDRN